MLLGWRVGRRGLGKGIGSKVGKTEVGEGWEMPLSVR
jgi:hypothetical protein